MPPRRNRRAARTAAELADALPARFYAPQPVVVEGQPVGLRHYLRDLTAHLDECLASPRKDDPGPVEVMTALGIPPSEWRRAALARRDN